MDPTQKFVRRHQHDLTSAQVRIPADLVFHHSQDVPETHAWSQLYLRKKMMHSELLARIVLSSSTYQVILHSLPLILLCQRGCLWFYSLRAGFSVMSPPGASACRHLLISFSPGSAGTSPALRSIRALLISRTRFLSATLSLHVSLLASPAKILSEFISTWFRRFFLRCKQRVSWTTSHVSVCLNIRRQNEESSTLNLWRFLSHNSWQ